jgi:hypothetical protein
MVDPQYSTGVSEIVRSSLYRYHWRINIVTVTRAKPLEQVLHPSLTSLFAKALKHESDCGFSGARSSARFLARD